MKHVSFKKLVQSSRGIVSILAIISLVLNPYMGKVHAVEKDTVDVSAVRVPEAFGIVKEVHKGTNNKVVFHIQDAHCNFEAQDNNAKILRGLIDNQGVKVVTVEGSAGVVDTAPFSGYPNKKARDDVALYFMQNGRITGPEYLAITGERAINLFGIEDQNLYKQNYDAFIKSLTFKSKAKDNIKELKGILLSLMQNMYSPDLKGFNAKVLDYKDGKIKFTEFAKVLNEYADHLKIDTKDFKNLSLQKETQALEAAIDFDKVEKERAALVDQMSKKLSKNELSDLVTKSLSFRLGRMSSEEYYTYLKDQAAKAGLDLKASVNLAKYVDYLVLFARIDKEGLMDEAERLESAIKEKMFGDKDQKDLDRLAKDLDVLGKLFDLKLSIKDYKHFRDHAADFNSKRFLDFIRKYAPKYGVFVPNVKNIAVLDDNIGVVEKFYDVATKRDEVLVKNMIQKMNKDGVDRIVMVTGGFHTDGIRHQLQAKGYSYMIITPRITKFDIESPYVDVMMGKKTALETMMSGEGVEQNTLAPDTQLDKDKFKTVYKALADLETSVDGRNIAGITDALQKLTGRQDVVVNLDQDGSLYYYFAQPVKAPGVVYRIAPQGSMSPFMGTTGISALPDLVAQAGMTNTIGAGYTVQVYTANDQVRAYLAGLTRAPTGPTRIAAGTPGDPMAPEEEAELSNYVKSNMEVLERQTVTDSLKSLYDAAVKKGLKFAIVPSNNPSDKYQLLLGKAAKKEAYGNVFDGAFVITKEVYNLLKNPAAANGISKEVAKSLVHETTELTILTNEKAKKGYDPSLEKDLAVYAHIRGLMAESSYDGETYPTHIEKWLEILMSRGDWDTINKLLSNTNAKLSEISSNYYLNKYADAGRFAASLAKHIQNVLLKYTRRNAIVVRDDLRLFLGNYIDLIDPAKTKVSDGIVTLVNDRGETMRIKVLKYGDNTCLQIGNVPYLVRGKAVDLSKLNPLGNPEYIRFFNIDVTTMRPEYLSYALPVDDSSRTRAADPVPVNRLQQPGLLREVPYTPADVTAAKEALANIPEDVTSLTRQDILKALNDIAIVGLNGATTKTNDAGDYYQAQAELLRLIKATDRQKTPELYYTMVELADHMLFSFVGCDWLQWQKIIANQQQKKEPSGVKPTFIDLPPEGLEIVKVEAPKVSELQEMQEKGDIFDKGKIAVMADKGVAQMPMAGGASSTVRGLTGLNKLVHVALKVWIKTKDALVPKWISILQARLGLIFGQNPKTKIFTITSSSGTNLAEPDKEVRSMLTEDYPAEMQSGQIRVAMQRLGLCLNPETGYPLRFSDGHVVTAAENHLWALMPILMDKDLLVDFLKNTNGIVSIGNGDNVLNYTRPGMVGPLLDARQQGRSLATVALCTPPAGDKKCGIALKITYRGKDGKEFTRTEFRETSEFPAKKDTGYGAVVIAPSDPRYAKYEKNGMFIEDLLSDRNDYPVNIAFYAVDLKLMIARMLGMEGALKDMKDDDIIKTLQNTSNVDWTKKALDVAYKARVVPVPSKKAYNEDGTELRTGYVEERAIQNLIVNGLPAGCEADILITYNRAAAFLPYKGTPQDIFAKNGQRETDLGRINRIVEANKPFGDKVVKIDPNNGKVQVYDVIANGALYEKMIEDGIPMRVGDGTVNKLEAPISLKQILDEQKRRGTTEELAKAERKKSKRISLDTLQTLDKTRIVDAVNIYPAIPERLDIDADRGLVDTYAPNKVLDVFFSVKLADTETGLPVNTKVMSDDQFFKAMDFYLYVYDETEKNLIETVNIKNLNGIQPVGRNPVTELYDAVKGDQEGMKRFKIQFNFPVLERIFRKNMKMGVHDLNVKIKMVSPNGVSTLIALAPFSKTNEYGNLLLRKLFFSQRPSLGQNITRAGNPKLFNQWVQGYMNNGDPQILTLLRDLMTMETDALDREKTPAEKMSAEEAGIYMDRKGAFIDAVTTLMTAQEQLGRDVPVVQLLVAAMNTMDDKDRAQLIEKTLPAYIEEVKSKPAENELVRKDQERAAAYARSLIAVARLSHDVAKNAVADVDTIVKPKAGEVEVSGQTVVAPEEVKVLINTPEFDALKLNGKNATPEVIQNLLMELATRKHIQDNDPYLKKLVDLTKKFGIEELSISLKTIAVKEGDVIRNRGVGFAKILEKLSDMGVHVNIYSDLDEALMQDILQKAEGISADKLKELNAKKKGQVALIEKVTSAKETISGIEKKTGRKVAPEKSRFIIDKSESSAYTKWLQDNKHPYFVGVPGMSIAALVTVIMTAENPLDKQEVVKALKQLGIDEAVIAEYEKQGMPATRQTESMLKYLYNNPRTFETAA